MKEMALANRLVRMITVIALLVGVCSPAICSTLCAIGVKCGTKAVPVAVSEPVDPKCSNCPKPYSGPGYKQSDAREDCCCGWMAKKSDPPAAPVHLTAVQLPDADLPPATISSVTPSRPATAVRLPSNDRAPPGRYPILAPSRAPPMPSM